MSKNFFGKRSVAVLSALAILVSLVAMLGGLSMTSSAAYTPSRTYSITSDSSLTDAKITITNAADKVTAGTVVTVKGYYKVDNFTGVAGQVAYGYIAKGVNNITTTSYPAYASTNGWVAFELKNYTVGNDAANGWIQFGFVNAYGTFSVADVTLVNSAGTVLYSMATDTALTAGTYNAFPIQHGIWYSNAKSATIGAVSSGSSSGGSTSTTTLTMTASATTVANNADITLSCPGATSIVVSRVDGQWSQTYAGASQTLAFGWDGEYTAYGTDGTNKSNSVNFTVGSSTPTGNKPTSATLGTDKSVYKIGTNVIFSLIGDGDTNTLWIYKPDGTSEYFQNAGTSYTYIPTAAGQYEALMETWNGVAASAPSVSSSAWWIPTHP